MQNSHHSFTLLASNSLEQNVKIMAGHYNNIIQPGHGLFFDFSDTPELEKPVINYLITQYNWTLEKPFFIRKPEPLQYPHIIPGKIITQYTLTYN